MFCFSSNEIFFELILAKRKQMIKCEQGPRQLNWNWFFVFYLAMFAEQRVDVELTFDWLLELIHPTDQTLMNHLSDYLNAFHLENFSKWKFIQIKKKKKTKKEIYLSFLCMMIWRCMTSCSWSNSWFIIFFKFIIIILIHFFITWIPTTYTKKKHIFLYK